MSNVDKKWEEVQKKAFTHWVNSQLGKRDESIENLETGFVSGLHLITLVEILSGKKIETKYSKKPKLKVHKITNCYIALNFLSDQCGVKGITVSAEDIVNGDRMTFILGFCWLLLRTFQAPANEKAPGSSFESNLLQWCKDTLHGYKDITVDSFKSESFINGKALLALINEFDGSILKYSEYDAHNKFANCDTALKLAEEHLKLPVLIDAEELAEGKTSEKNIVLYLSLMHNAFKERASGETRDSLLKKVKELEEKIAQIIAENDTLRNSKTSLEHHQKDLTENLHLVTTEKTEVTHLRDQISTQFSDLQSSYSKETSELKEKIEELQQNIKLLQSSSADTTTNLQSAKDEMKKERDSVREELKKTKEALAKEKEELTNKQNELISNLKKNQKAREELEEIMNKKQEAHGQSIHALRKRLLKHVHDMHVWKNFLDQERDYESEDLHVTMFPELVEFPFSEQVHTLDTAISEENVKLDSLKKEREEEIKAEAAASKGKGDEVKKVPSSQTTQTKKSKK